MGPGLMLWTLKIVPEQHSFILKTKVPLDMEKPMRPQHYTKNYRQMSKSRSRRGGSSPGKNTPIGHPVPNDQL